MLQFSSCNVSAVSSATPLATTSCLPLCLAVKAHCCLCCSHPSSTSAELLPATPVDLRHRRWPAVCSTSTGFSYSRFRVRLSLQLIVYSLGTHSFWQMLLLLPLRVHRPPIHCYWCLWSALEVLHRHCAAPRCVSIC